VTMVVGWWGRGANDKGWECSHEEFDNHSLHCYADRAGGGRQAEEAGDGTTSAVGWIDGIVKSSERRLQEGINTRILTGVVRGREC
jgi:hypothetical protein